MKRTLAGYRTSHLALRIHNSSSSVISPTQLPGVAVLLAKLVHANRVTSSP